MSTYDGDLNRSAQHFTFEAEVECDATTTEAAFLYGGGECRDLGPMAQGRRAQVDRACLRQEFVLDLRAHLPNRRHSAAAPATFPACADAGRAGRGVAGRGRWGTLVAGA